MSFLVIPLVLRVTNCLIPTKKIFVSRDVLFHETMFPFISSSHSFSPHSNIAFPHLFPPVAFLNDSLLSFSSISKPHFASDSSPQVLDPIPSSPVSNLSVPMSIPLSGSSNPSPPDSIPTTSVDSAAIPSLSLVPSYPPLRKPNRITKPPSYLQDYKCSSIVCDKLVHSNHANKSGSSTSFSGTKYPLSNYLDSFKLSLTYAHFCSLISNIPKPKFYHEAIKDPNWQDALVAKIATSESNNTWTLTPLPPHKRAIGFKWVYRVKYNADGSME